MRRALTVSLLFSGALACSGCRAVDETPPGGYPPGDRSPKSSSLSRRLSEAADGYRDGKPKWVVAHRKGDDKRNHRVVGVFPTAELAESIASKEGPQYGAFGPFLTEEEKYEIPPDDRVDSIIIVYKNNYRVAYLGDSVDAVFWGLPAFDKFIVPYLSSVSSAAYAEEQRELYRSNRSKLAGSEAVVHKRGSL